MSELFFKQESYKIIGACMEVHKTLGMGFLEVVYKDALELEFKRLEIPYVREKNFELFYKGVALNRTFQVDFWVYNQINLEIKSKSMLVEEHILQTKNYCACAKCKLGILVNFGQSSLEYKRIIL